MNPQEAIDNGALVFVSHSGGKDSQAMYAHLRGFVPKDQIIVVHANLGEVEWTGVIDHIEANIAHDLNIVRAGKTLLEMVERRHASRPDVPCWPSPKHRQCTSDLKRGPIQKFIRHEMKRRGSLLAINAMGLRAEESSARAKRPVWQLNKTLSKAGRTVLDWNPIHDWGTAKVFNKIRAFGQEPFHAYKSGNERLSCVFCIMGCDSDLRNGARHNPGLLAKYIELEERTGYTMFPTGSLAERLANSNTPQQDLFTNARTKK